MGVAALLLFTGFILPRLMLKTHAATLPVRDKAVGRLSDEFGAKMRYAPADSVRPYIKEYIIATDGGGMYFRGEWGRILAYADYELTVYNRDNKIIDILRVKEKFNGGKYTHITRLPQETDYVTLRLLCVNDEPVIAEPQPFRRQYALWLAALCLCLAATVDLLLWLGVTFVLRCLDDFTMSYFLPDGTWAAILVGAAALVILMTCAFSLGGFFLRRKEYLHGKP